MKRFLQSRWGIASIVAISSLVIMGGVVVMGKGMIDDPSKKPDPEKSAKADPKDSKKSHAAPSGLKTETGTTQGQKPTGISLEELQKNINSEIISKYDGAATSVNTGGTGNDAATTNPDEPDSVPPAPQLNKDIRVTTVESIPLPPGQSAPAIPTPAIPAPAIPGNPVLPPDEPVATPESNTDGEPEWSYTGQTGPFHWHKLKSDWAIAGAGIRQSPIDIIPERALAMPTLKPLEFHYTKGLHTLLDNGHTIQVKVNKDENYIVIDDRKYQLLQFHFHAKSEHTFKGVPSQMEVHLVHALAEEDPLPADDASSPEDASPTPPQARPTQYAVIAVMINQGDTDHPFIKDLWTDLDEVKPHDKGIRFRLEGPMSLLPPEGKRSYYRYNGSLTTPPCSETVLWTVMDEPVQFSAAQIEAFTKRYPNNFRKPQPLHRRFVLKYEDQSAGPEILPTPAKLVPAEKLPPPPAIVEPEEINPLPIPEPEEPENKPVESWPDLPLPSPKPLPDTPTIGVRGGSVIPLPRPQSR